MSSTTSMYDSRVSVSKSTTVAWIMLDCLSPTAWAPVGRSQTEQWWSRFLFRSFDNNALLNAASSHTLLIAVWPRRSRRVQGRRHQVGQEAPDDVHRVVGQDARGSAVRLRGARGESHPDARTLGNVLGQEEQHHGGRGRRRGGGLFLLMLTIELPFVRHSSQAVCAGLALGFGILKLFLLSIHSYVFDRAIMFKKMNESVLLTR